MFFKVLGKFVNAIVSEGEGNIGNVTIVASQHFFCFFDAQLMDIVDRGYTIYFKEKLSKIDGRYVTKRRKILVFDGLRKVAGDIVDSGCKAHPFIIWNVFCAVAMGVDCL